MLKLWNLIFASHLKLMANKSKIGGNEYSGTRDATYNTFWK